MTKSMITRVPILPFGMVNAHLIRGSGGCVLVDAGLPGSEAKFHKALASLGLSFKDIKLIVVTHAHVDHAGGAYGLRERSGAPIVAHADDAKYFRRETPMTYCPSDRVGHLFLKTPLPHVPYRAFVPDIQLSNNDTLSLDRYGIAGLIRHTPGHTAGSLSVVLSSKDALVGDLVASGILLGGLMRRGHARRPPFEDDPYAVGVALHSLVEWGIERFYLGHGGPLGAREVARHARMLMEMNAASRDGDR